VEVRSRPVGQRERVALGVRIAARQTFGVHVGGLCVLLGLEELVSGVSEYRRHGGFIVLHVEVQRIDQHFVFA